MRFIIFCVIQYIQHKEKGLIMSQTKEIFINITEEMKLNAINHSKERMNYEFNRFKQNDTFRFNMLLIGTLGELVFKNYLESRSVSFNMEFQAGKYDSMDFEVNNRIIEIKTSGIDETGYSWLNLLYNSDQYQQAKNKNYSYVVLIFVDGYDRTKKTFDISLTTTAIIYGYIEFKKIGEFQITDNKFYSNHKVSLNELNPIDEII